jgi:tellurite methyltransferase
MTRVIVGFHLDDMGEWVAELSCLHNQHVRHRPPFQDRSWVTTDAGRRARTGTEIDCPLCDRAEPPPGLRLVRTAGPFDAGSLPAGLQQTHVVAERTWGYLRVIEGSIQFSMETEPPIRTRLDAGQAQSLPPGVPHRLTLNGPVVLAVDFAVAADKACPSTT